MKLIDLSQPLYDGCPGWPSDPPVRVKMLSKHPRDPWQVESLTLTAHSGSHLDAPRHRIQDGPTIDELPLESFGGKAVIADFRGTPPRQPLLSAMIRQALLPIDLRDRIVLLATGWGDKPARTKRWLTQAPFLAPEAARWLKNKGVRGVGIDSLSIGGACEPFNSRTHRILLKAGVWILENIRFPAGAFRVAQPCQLWALPVHLKGMSGSFCRPVIVYDI